MFRYLAKKHSNGRTSISTGPRLHSRAFLTKRLTADKRLLLINSIFYLNYENSDFFADTTRENGSVRERFWGFMSAAVEARVSQLGNWGCYMQACIVGSAAAAAKAPAAEESTLVYSQIIPRWYGVAIELSMGFLWYGIAMFLWACQIVDLLTIFVDLLTIFATAGDTSSTAVTSLALQRRGFCILNAWWCRVG